MCSAYTLMFCPGAARAQREGLAAPCAALGSGAGRARHTAVLPRASAPGWWTGQCLAWRTELPVRLAVRRRRRRRRELGARAYYARPRWPTSPVHEPRPPPPVRLRARGKRPNNSTPGTSRAPVRRGPKRELRAPRRQAPRTALAPPRGRRRSQSPRRCAPRPGGATGRPLSASRGAESGSRCARAPQAVARGLRWPSWRRGRPRAAQRHSRRAHGTAP